MKNTTQPTTLDIEPTNQDSHKTLLESHATAEALSRYIEVLLHASETPLTDQDLKKHLSMSSDELQMALIILKERLSGSVLTLGKTASGYRLQIKDSYSRLIQQIFPERLESLSQALLETLSVIAYKQPVTRGDIEQVRGVTVSSNILRQLFDKGWIMEKGHKDTLGRPALLHTTPAFLDAFGLDNLEQLPPLPNLPNLQIDVKADAPANKSQATCDQTTTQNPQENHDFTCQFHKKSLS